MAIGSVRGRLPPQPLQVGPHIGRRLIAEVGVLVKGLVQNAAKLRGNVEFSSRGAVGA